MDWFNCKTGLQNLLFGLMAITLGCQEPYEPPIPVDPCFYEDVYLGKCDLDVSISDQELFDTIYSEFKFHDNFYQEDLDGISIYYENTISVKQKDPWRIMCTDSFELARSWTISSSVHSSVRREIIETKENEKYFEFIKMDPNNPRDKLRSRVLKCDYVEFCYYERDNYEEPTFLLDRTIDKEELTEFAEFWLFSQSYNFGGAKYLTTISCETVDSVFVNILGTSVVFGDYGLKDEITLKWHNYAIHKSGGVILSEIENIRTIPGRLN